MADREALARIDATIEEHVDEFIDDLARLVAQPSVAAQGLGIDECAELVAGMLRERGYSAEVMPTGGSPVVYGEGEGRADKTLLFYLHYDVQPPEPLELWDSPPYELTQRDGNIYGRGTSDDKGHIVARLAALEAVRQVLGELPVDVKFVIEGEEEIGSPHLPEFVERHKAKLAADACVWEFGAVDFDGVPLHYLGMRGIMYVELVAKTASVDAHSGIGGSVFPNAAWRLVWALNTLKGEDERIRIPGFYDDIVPPTERDMALLEAIPKDRWTRYQEMFGLKGYLGGVVEPLELNRMSVFEPTCTICGLKSGYQEAGTKTVLPAEALAKVDFRLVPDQDPQDILVKLRAHLEAEGFEDVEVRLLGGEPPARTDPDDPFIGLVNEAAREVYGVDPIIEPIVGGSGPNHAFIHHLHVPVAMTGVAHPGNRAHAPNEHIRRVDFVNGVKHMAHILVAYGEADFK